MNLSQLEQAAELQRQIDNGDEVLRDLKSAIETPCPINFLMLVLRAEEQLLASDQLAVAKTVAGLLEHKLKTLRDNFEKL